MSQSESQSQSHRFQSIGIDAVAHITQYLFQNELRIFMQLNRSCAHILEQRHQAYYHLSLPSFHRDEFNLTTYRQWLHQRTFSVITSPDQLLAFSRSRIMTHAIDLEIQLGDDCMTPSFPHEPGPVTSVATVHTLILTAIQRFRHVRSVRLVFCPSTYDRDRANASTLISPNESAVFQYSFMDITEMCLEEWAPKLISFEVERDAHYRCNLPPRLIFQTSQLTRMTALQHLGFFFPSNKYGLVPKIQLMPRIPPSVSAFQFPDEERSVFIFESGCPDERDDQGRLIAPTRFTNAGCIEWRDGPPNIFPYLYESGQLLFGPYQEAPPLNTIAQPMINFRPHQIRTLCIHPVGWRPSLKKEQVNVNVNVNFNKLHAYMTHTLEVMAHNFTTLNSLESLIISDELYKYRASQPPFIYAPYLDPLRTSLRSLTIVSSACPIERASDSEIASLTTVTCYGCDRSFIPLGHRWKCTICTHFDYCTRCHDLNRSLGTHLNTHRMVQTNRGYLYRPALPPLPISLIESDADFESMNSRQWSRLESLTLRFTFWEFPILNGLGRSPPITRTTWISLARTLPALTSLSISLGLLPFRLEPFSGLLLRIKHLTLWDVNAVNTNRLDYPTYLSPAIYAIVTQLRQLESLTLQLKGLDLNKSGPFIDCVVLVVLSSANLRSLSIQGLHLHSLPFRELTQFESRYQERLFQFYAVWKLLQPSFEPPLTYSSIPAFLYPLLPPIWWSRFDRDLHQLGEKYGHHPVRAAVPVPVRPLATRVKAKLSDWWTRLSKKKNEPTQEVAEVELKRERERAELIETRTTIFQTILDRFRKRMDHLYQQHPEFTFQPRLFTFTLEPKKKNSCY